MRTGLALLLVFLGVGVAHAATLHRDVEYGVADGESLRLDLSVPDGSGPFPVVILIHGGGWGGGDKAGSDRPGNGADITPWFAPLSDAGFLWVSINYRLAPRHRWPACYEDVLTAIRWVKQQIAAYGGDPTRIALFGHSAGGHLASLAAVQASTDTRVQALVGFAPVTDFEQELPRRGGLSPALQALHNRPAEVTPESLALLRATSPITHVHADVPPVLILHGDADQTVPIEQSRGFQARLQAVGVRCDLIVVPGAPHGLLRWNEFLPGYADRYVAWLREVMPVKTADRPFSP